MARLLLSLLAASWFLFGTSSALKCENGTSLDEDQGLNMFAVAQVSSETVEGVSRVQDCWKKCCGSPDCDMMQMGYPMDGPPQCMLVKCWVNGEDGCPLKPSNQFKVYRKASGIRPKKLDGKRVRVVPLVKSFEPKESIDSNNIRCRLPMKVGRCRAAFPKYFYNSTAMSCQSFTYGGCDGNGNNFNTEEECEAACSGVTSSVLPDESTAAPPPAKPAARVLPVLNRDVSKDVAQQYEEEEARTVKKEMSAKEFAEHCGGEPVVGPCRAAFKRWYYNSNTGSCQVFVYGGCRGSANRYDSESSCMAACTVAVLPSAKKVAADVPPEDYQEKCLEKPDPGPCRAAFKNFYYNPVAGSCLEFFYGGCRGNRNRYQSLAECMDSCDGLHVYSRSENRWTAGLFLFITLAVISALLLVALIIMLRRRNVLRRFSSLSDKEELLPEEQSSVESLSAPDSPTKADKA